MICTNCGNEVENGNAFCPNCGTKIVNYSGASVNQMPAYAQPVATGYNSQQPTFNGTNTGYVQSTNGNNLVIHYTSVNANVLMVTRLAYSNRKDVYHHGQAMEWLFIFGEHLMEELR